MWPQAICGPERRTEAGRRGEKMRIFDTHAHYDDRRFDDDREELLGGMLRSGGVEYVTNIAADMDSVKTTNELTEKYDYIYGALGVHPEGILSLEEEDMETIARMAAENKKIRAIGETGFDFSGGYPDKETQEKWFRRQIRLAKDLKLPIVVHSRDAAEDTYRVLASEYERREGIINGVIHCFSYAYEEAVKYIRLGFLIGVGGVVTFKNGRKLKDTVSRISLRDIVLETDCPYLCPDPHRGERNSSLYIPYIVNAVAGLKEVTSDEVCEAAMENGKRLYGIEG